MQEEERIETEKCLIQGGINLDKETASLSVASLTIYIRRNQVK